jgi:hypothetical protein
MMELFLSYLSLLDALREKLATLCDLAAQKTAAVCNDDLAALNNVMKQEQALALAFRGLEQKKSTQAKALGVEAVPLSKLPEQYPEELRLQAGYRCGKCAPHGGGEFASPGSFDAPAPPAGGHGLAALLRTDFHRGNRTSG